MLIIHFVHLVFLLVCTDENSVFLDNFALRSTTMRIFFPLKQVVLFECLKKTLRHINFMQHKKEILLLE